MFSPPRPLRVLVSCLLAITSLTFISHAQNVTTWHNDNNRTGWQQNETMLKPSTVSQTAFGLLWQWPVTGYVFAQPLAVTLPQSVGTCANPCSLVLIATEQDMLYAFNASPSAQCQTCHPLVWSLNLGTPVQCSALPPGVPYDPCSSGLLGPYVGVTGTPVIDTTITPDTLYVSAAVQSTNSISFYLFAVDITTGLVRGTAVPVSGMVNGQSPGGGNGLCTSDFPASGTVHFDYNHIQRSALLLLPNGTVYLAFAPGGGEVRNGWMFGYSFNGSAFTKTATFNSTPYGTGGGIWQAGAGPAYDGNYIYAAIANGTLFDVPTQVIPVDIGDSLVKLDPSTLSVVDFYAPSNALSYVGTKQGMGLCKNDEDFGSGGVLLPLNYSYNGKSVVINADKQSNLYVADQASLGKFNASTNCTNSFNNIQCITTPPIADSLQGYWASPAYWHYNDGQDHYMLYYSVTDQTSTVGAYPINGYTLSTSGPGLPIPSSYVSTNTLFCFASPTPSVSSNSTMAGTGIVWAIENQTGRDDSNNTCDIGPPPYVPAALHAFNATNLAQELYNGRAVTTPTGYVKGFPTPTIFRGQVYMGTTTGPPGTLPGVNVFGLCRTALSGHCMP